MSVFARNFNVLESGGVRTDSTVQENTELWFVAAA